ncbi:MAG: FAD-dependent oxidoreductase [Actinomycetota bacterium]
MAAIEPTVGGDRLLRFDLLTLCWQGGVMVALERCVIVGASLAGLRVAETLRQADAVGEVVLIGAELHRPYDRPPLSKKVLAGEWDAERAVLRPPETLDALEVTWRLGEPATALTLDGATPAVELAGGEVVAGDAVFITTGAHPRRIADASVHPNVHVLRSLDDALALRAEFDQTSRRVVVIGAGFIGLEVAATARRGGHEVVVVEAADAPLIRGLGAEMGTAIGELHRAEGVDVRCGAGVDEFTDSGVIVGGDHVDADVIVLGVGAVPTTGWLEGSGIALDDGVVCDAALRALDSAGNIVPGVYAAGDVVRWDHPRFGGATRVEHWTNAVEQGAHAAQSALAVAAGEEPVAYAPLPFFWSDQFDHRIQFLGHPGPHDHVEVVAGATADGKWLAMYTDGDRLTGTLGVNAPKWVMPTRRWFADELSPADARAAASELA